ncbi:MAG: FecR family protein [Chitinophagales bacterium]|nr:FecR family protein [Chitinophagales bacterium]
MPDRIWYLLSLKLSGEATKAELDEFYALLEANPELEEAVQQITLYWLQKSTVTNEDASQDLWEKHLHRMEQSGIEWASPSIELAADSALEIDRSPRIWLWRSVRVAAVFLFALAGWWIFRPASETKREIAAINQNQVSTRPASKTKLTLPDGSKVWLNASSKLTYGNGFGEKHREIWLEGEGYFDVAKNKQIPFVIHTSRMDVRVTGTVFNVRAYAQEPTSETALIEGSVEVTLSNDKSKKFYLKPKQKLVVDEHGLVNSAKEMPSLRVTPAAFTASLQALAKPLEDNQVVETAWVYNMLSFSDESFRQVANKFEKWYAVEIRFEDPELEDLRFTGSFRDETLAEALKAMQLTTPGTPFGFVVRERQVTIQKARPN